MDALTEVTIPNVRNYRGQLPFNKCSFSSSEKNVISGKELIIFFAFRLLKLLPFASLSRALKRTPLKRCLNCNNSYSFSSEWRLFFGVRCLTSYFLACEWSVLATISPFRSVIESAQQDRFNEQGTVVSQARLTSRCNGSLYFTRSEQTVK